MELEQNVDDLFAMAELTTTPDTSRKLEGAVSINTQSTETCQHEFTVEHDGEVFCNDCGEALRELDTDFRKEKTKSIEDGGRCQSLQTGSMGILPDIQHIGSIPKNIKDRANRYFIEYMQTTNSNVLRQKSRRSVIAAVIYYAYLQEKSIAYPIEQLAELLTVSLREASQSLHKVARKLPHLRNVQVTVIDVMNQLLRKLHATEQLDFQWVEYIYRVIEHQSSVLNKARMNSVASGVVWYYIQRESKPISIEYFSRICELSKNTITNIAATVEETYLENGGDDEE